MRLQPLAPSVRFLVAISLATLFPVWLTCASAAEGVDERLLDPTVASNGVRLGRSSAGRGSEPQANPDAFAGRRAFRDPADVARKLQSAQTVFPFRVVHHGDDLWKLPAAEAASAFAPVYAWKGRTYGLGEFNERTHTSAMLILKDGKIVHETYLAGASPETLFFGYSLSKSFTSTLVGMALEDGSLGSLDERLSHYLPTLACGAYEGVTIRDALQMLSGVEFMPGHFSWTDESIPAARVYQSSLVNQRYRYIEGANSLKRAYPIRSKFSYCDMDAALLGGVLENATRQRLATYMEERLWKPAGMEADAVWILDGPPEIGREVAALSFAATLRDYGRFGLLALQRGNVRGKQLVSPDWFQSATTPGRRAVEFGQLSENYPLGYGYYWWLLPNGAFTGQGAFGHFIYVVPQANVVIVKHSHWPKEWDDELEMEMYSFCDGVVRALGTRD